MSKDEKLLKKIGKLLTLYGVSEEEKSNFLNDIQDAKYDESDEEEETEQSSTEEEASQEETTFEEKGSEEEQSSTEEEKTEVEESSSEEETKSDEENSTEEQVSESEESSKEGEEESTEESQEESGEEEAKSLDPQARIEELVKANEGLSARLATLEEIVSKLGVEVQEEDQTIGASPNGNAVDEKVESAFDTINRKRLGY